MQFLPDGTIQIRNKKTGESKTVPPAELGNYGITQKQYLDEFTAYNTLQDKAKKDSGEDYYSQAAKKGLIDQETAVKNQVSPDLASTLPTSEEISSKKKEADAKTISINKMKAIQQNAHNVLDIITKGKTGELKGKAYDDALNFAVSDYNKRAFSEGGSQLSPLERGVVSGTMINTSATGPNLPQRSMNFLFGSPMPTVREINSEDPESLIRKMNLGITNIDKNINTISPQGGGQPPITQAGTAPMPEAPQANPNDPYAGQKLNLNPVENVANNAVDIVKGIGDTANLLKEGALSGMDLLENPENADFSQLLPTYGNMAKGIAQDAGRAAGVYVDKDGKVRFDPVGGLIYDYNHPIDTAFKAQMVKSLTPKSVKQFVGNKASGAVKSVKSHLPKLGKSDVSQRVLESVATPDAGSVANTDKLMRDTMQISKSNTYRGVASDLEKFKPKVRAYIQNYVKDLDKNIGMQSMDETTAGLKQVLQQTPVGQSSPDLVNKVIVDFQNQAAAGKMASATKGLPAIGQQRAGLTGTTFEKLNSTREWMGRDLDSWFTGGRPTSSPADQIRALRWETAKYIKDSISQADQGGNVSKALDLYHSAIETSPVIAKEALSGKGLFHSSSLTGIAKDTVAAPFRMAKIPAAHVAAGKAPPIIDDILNGAPAPVQTPTVGLPPIDQSRFTSKLPTSYPPGVKPIPQGVTTPLGDAVPTTGTSITRDMRFSQGNFQPTVETKGILDSLNPKKFNPNFSEVEQIKLMPEKVQQAYEGLKSGMHPAEVASKYNLQINDIQKAGQIMEGKGLLTIFEKAHAAGDIALEKSIGAQIMLAPKGSPIAAYKNAIAEMLGIVLPKSKQVTPAATSFTPLVPGHNIPMQMAPFIQQAQGR